VKKLVKAMANRVLASRGLAIGPMNDDQAAGNKQYIDATATVAAAQREGLSVCDYVEKLWNQQGDTDRVIEKLKASGIFAGSRPSILEIGPGTGRYLERVLQQCEPTRYECYEIATDWARWLSTKYPVVTLDTDGVSLKQTPNDSIDLLLAHGVFVCLPFLSAWAYWKEMWRVVKANGWIAFDLYTEGCMEEETVEKWLASSHSYPSFFPKGYVVKQFEAHGFTLNHSFYNRHGQGRSEYLVFQRKG
jgi:SAM-dependent methyltransferase